MVEDRYVRGAVPGGTGEAKTGGNYASSLKAGLEAKKKALTRFSGSTALSVDTSRKSAR